MWGDKAMTRNRLPARGRRLGAVIALALVLAACGEQRFSAPEAMDFTLPELEGARTVSLGDYRGDVVYLSFWASWCVPCQDEMPHLATLWREHRKEGFQVIGINVDENPAAARAFAGEHDIPFPLVRDEDRAVSKLYRVAGYPSHYIVDRRGRVRYSAIGFNDDDSAAISVEVETLLKESAVPAD